VARRHVVACVCLEVGQRQPDRVREFGHRTVPHPGRGQHDRQRQALQPAHEARHGRQRCRVELETGVDAPRRLLEQRHGVGRLVATRRRVVSGSGHQGRQREACDRHDRLPRHVERFARRREDAHVRARGGDRTQHPRAGQDVLEVVDEQEGSRLAQRRHHDVLRVRPVGQRNVERLREAARDVVGPLDVGERHEGRAVREGRCAAQRGLEGHAGLADAPGTDQRHEPHRVVPHQALHLAQVPLTAHERRRMRRQR